jgi:lipoyl(octanoyl) transferase
MTPMAGVWRWPELADYATVFEAMQTFTARRQPDDLDELWLVEHSPVYTLGQAGKPEHILNSADIAVVQSDRGGQVTYHGPGQVVIYMMADLKRTTLTIRAMVQALEQALIDTLGSYGLTHARREPGAPGVYLPRPDGRIVKIAALGIKVRKGYTYHGVALNVDMDLAPFLGINPCGYQGLETVSMATEGVFVPWEAVAMNLAGSIVGHCRLRVK